MKPIVVVYQFNEKYVPYAGISITSLLENNKDAEEIVIYILGENILEHSKMELKKAVEKYKRKIEFLNTDNLLKSFKEWGLAPYRGAYSVYLRIFFADIIPNDIDRVMYIDSDTVVVGSVKELFSIDMNSKAVGMVLDSIGNSHKIDIGMKDDSDYYNTGMILFDIGVWKERKYQEKIIEHAKNVRAEYPTADQDLLNVVIEGDVYRLPIQYNFQPQHEVFSNKSFKKQYGFDGYYSDKEIDYGRENTVIQHCYRWMGEFPWHKGNLHPFNDSFEKYLSISEWSNYLKQREKNGIVIKIEKLLYRLLPKSLFIVLFKKAHMMSLNKLEKQMKRM